MDLHYFLKGGDGIEVHSKNRFLANPFYAGKQLHQKFSNLMDNYSKKEEGIL